MALPNAWAAFTLVVIEPLIMLSRSGASSCTDWRAFLRSSEFLLAILKTWLWNSLSRKVRMLPKAPTELLTAPILLVMSAVLSGDWLCSSSSTSIPRPA
jgi:hypothetical protein